MGGLAKICRMYGSIGISDTKGKNVVWVWDYANEKPRLESEMSDDEKKQSEKAKWLKIKKQL